MPKHLRDNWGRFIMKKIKPRFLNLRDLSDWISERREAADLVTDEPDAAPCRPVRPSYKKRRKLRVMAMATSADPSVPVCILCDGGHLLPSCPVFIGM
ncbi:hypothetical protein M513_12051 [Trichuris suis]|uniref:Uncharacterized protein n=1 Tax=Trichuris suis TaxID=68888 RepID=A0A085LQ17_9BILA|nr:hypothetical protein M513_12051 [Trichuris suis]